MSGNETKEKVMMNFQVQKSLYKPLIVNFVRVASFIIFGGVAWITMETLALVSISNDTELLLEIQIMLTGMFGVLYFLNKFVGE